MDLIQLLTLCDYVYVFPTMSLFPGFLLAFYCHKAFNALMVAKKVLDFVFSTCQYPSIFLVIEDQLRLVKLSEELYCQSQGFALNSHGHQSQSNRYS